VLPRYVCALGPSVTLDYAVYGLSVLFFNDKYFAFFLGRFSGFILFFWLAFSQGDGDRYKQFVKFLILFFVNLLVAWVIDEGNFLGDSHLIYKIGLDITLLGLNFIFFALIARKNTSMRKG